MRAIWTGEIAFGLVTIPVRLYSATRDLAPHFHYVHAKCGTRIVTVRRCPHCKVDVPWDQIKKGYEVSKGRYAVFTKEELSEIEGEQATEGVDIAEFVDAAEVDPVLVEKSYWVGPAGKSSRGFSLLYEALEKVGKVAIAKVRIRTRTRLAMLRPREGRFALDMMRFGDELVDAKEVDAPAHKAKGNPKELHLALGLIEQLTTSFDPKRHPDDYRSAVGEAVKKKVAKDELAEEGVEARSKAHAGKVVDLSDLLSASLGRKAHGAKKPPKKVAKTKPHHAANDNRRKIRKAS